MTPNIKRLRGIPSHTHRHTTDTSIHPYFDWKYIKEIENINLPQYFSSFFSSFPSFFLLERKLIHGEPGNTDNNVQTPLLSAGVLERPHAVAVHVPESARGRVHPSLADLFGASGGGLVDDALLDNGAVDGESVGRRRGFLVGCGCGDEVFQDRVLPHVYN